MTTGTLGQRERMILERAARGGWCFLNSCDSTAAVQMTEDGLGHWVQTSPFVATFYISDAGRDALERAA